MPTLMDHKPTGFNHALIIGKSKAGKTRLIAELIADGATVLYVDNDNGINTVFERLKDDPAALARCHFIPTENIYEFMTYFFARTTLLWNLTRDNLFKSTDPDTDQVTEIKISAIPYGVVIVFDSWTSTSNQLLVNAAKQNGVTLETFNNAGEAAYGDAMRRANNLLSLIQRAKFHIIVQAHETHYERMEKPAGSVNAKRKDMIVKENIRIPYSTSRPHGYEMSKYFNEVGWLEIGPTGAFILDWRQQRDRVGGGRLMNKGNPMDEMRLSKSLFPPVTIEGDWIRDGVASQFKTAKAAPAPQQVSGPKENVDSESKPALPTGPRTFSLAKK